MDSNKDLENAQEAINSFDKHLLSNVCEAGPELTTGDTALSK